MTKWKLMIVIFFLTTALAFSIARNIQYYNSGCIVIMPDGKADVDYLEITIDDAIAETRRVDDNN